MNALRPMDLDTDDVLIALCCDPGFLDFCDSLEKQAKATGCPQRFPLVVAMLIGTAVHAEGSKVKAMKRFRRLWRIIRPRLAGRYPHHRGLQPGSRPPSEKVYGRYMKRHEVHGERLSLAFEARAVAGYRLLTTDQNLSNSIAAPPSARTMRLDGTHLSLPWGRKDIDAANPLEPGEAPNKYDSGAGIHVTGDKRRVVGNKFVIASTYLSESNGTLILSVRPEENNKEADTALEIMRAIRSAIPAMVAAAYDGAARGVHIQIMYELGLLALVPPFDHSKDKNPNPLIDSITAKDSRGMDVTIDLYANRGRAAMRTVTNGVAEFVDLDVVRVTNRQSTAGTYRWYVILTIPDDPRFDDHLVGTRFRLRLDITDADEANGFNRTEHLRAYPPGTDQYKRLQGQRSLAESVNNSLKRNLRDGRGRSIEKNAQHADLVLSAIFANKHNELILNSRRQALDDAA
jgi:hypothetical protein